MSISSILVHLDGHARSAVRIHLATELANRFNAHLIGLAATGSIQIPGDAPDVFTGTYVSSVSNSMRETAEQTMAEFRKLTEGQALRPVETRLMLASPETALLEHGRFSDLLVLGQPDNSQSNLRSLNLSGMVYLLMGVARPALVIPHTGRFERLGKKVLVAWNDTPQSMRAVNDALPLLKLADTVDLLLFNPSLNRWTDGRDPGVDMATYLARHEVKVTVHSERTDIDIGNSIVSRAADLESDLIVMGAYGHSYLREMILGGVTQTLLSSMTVPVLMSH